MKGGRELIQISPILSDLQETNKSGPLVPETLRAEGAGAENKDARSQAQNGAQGGRRARESKSAGPQYSPRSCGTASQGTERSLGALGYTEAGARKTHPARGTRRTDRMRANEDPPGTTGLTFPGSSTPQDTVAEAHPGSQLPRTSTAQPEGVHRPAPIRLVGGLHTNHQQDRC